jgi:hypothetical protein
MSLTRRDVLRLAGGAVPSTVTLPRPFTIPWPVPSVLRPARSDATTDYYEVTEKLGEAEILPGHTTKIWGYCVTFPWPMLETHSRGSAGQAISLRQAAVTAGILGRTNASYRFTVTGIAAIGALIGGALGGLIRLRATMIVGALGTLAAMCFVIRSPIPKLLDLSELEPDGASAKTGPATCDEAAAPDDIARTPISPGPISPNHLHAKET